MWEMWFMAITQPPSAGIFSPSIHSCLVAVSSVGLTIATTNDHAHPRRSFSFRTLTTTTPFTRPLVTVQEQTTDAAGRIVVVTTPGYALLIPVKDGRNAKTRLGVGEDGERAELMAAFARDAITAATGVPGITVYVVGDPDALVEILDGLQVTVLPDEGDGQLNLALIRAARRLAQPDLGTAALLADLPCLRTGDLEAAFDDGQDRRFVADAAGTGTTLLIAPPGNELDPHFGLGSAAAHLASGARAVETPLTSLRLDVDTTDDLEVALRFGVGVHTAKVASRRSE